MDIIRKVNNKGGFLGGNIGDVDFFKQVVKRLCKKTIFLLRNLNLKSSRT
jgi:hypothetical protein